MFAGRSIISKLIKVHLFDFSQDSPMSLRITFIINSKVKILAVLALLSIKNLIKIKILHYPSILKVSIVLECLFVEELLHLLRTRFLSIDELQHSGWLYENDNENEKDDPFIQWELPRTHKRLNCKLKPFRTSCVLHSHHRIHPPIARTGQIWLHLHRAYQAPTFYMVNKLIVCGIPVSQTLGNMITIRMVELNCKGRNSLFSRCESQKLWELRIIYRHRNL